MSIKNSEEIRSKSSSVLCRGLHSGLLGLTFKIRYIKVLHVTLRDVTFPSVNLSGSKSVCCGPNFYNLGVYYRPLIK